MKKWKILSLLLSLCLLIGLLPTAALAADQTNDGAGIRIVQGDAYDSSTGIFSIKVQAKLPVGTGISSVGTLLSYDNTKLAVVNKNNTSKDVTSNEGVKKESEAIISKTLIQTVDDDENTKEYTLQDSAMYKAGDRSGIYTFHYNGKPLTQNATDAQTSGNWFDVYEVMFRVAGKPADPATVLNSDSLRIADVAKGDAAVMKGAFPANNIYSIYLTDNSNPARLYVLNRMSECTETEVTGEKSLMTAPETGTATYPGSTNPVTPPASATLTGIKVKTAPTKVIYTEGESFDKTGMVIEATYSDSTKKDVAGYTYAPTAALTTSDTTITISYTEGSETKTCTQAITVNAVTPDPGHVHTSHLTSVAAKAPTCTASGNAAYWKCSCGKLFSDATATAETTLAAVTKAALGHDHNGPWVKTDANEHWKVCAREGCNEQLDKAVHTPSAWVNVDEGHHHQTCIVCERELTHEVCTFGQPLKYNATSHWEECTKCGNKQNEAAHEFLPDSDKCTGCDYTKSSTITIITPTQPGDSKPAGGNPSTGAVSSPVGYVFVGLAVVGALCLGAKKLTKKHED